MTAVVRAASVPCMTAVEPRITAGEAAERLTAAGVKVSEDTVRRWAKDGRVPCIELPSGRFLFRIEDIDAIAEPSQRVAS